MFDALITPLRYAHMIRQLPPPLAPYAIFSPDPTTMAATTLYAAPARMRRRAGAPMMPTRVMMMLF